MKKKTFLNKISTCLMQRIIILFSILIVATFQNPLHAQKKKNDNDARCGYSKDLMIPFYKEVKTSIENLKQQNKLKFPESNRKKKTLANAGRSLLDPYVFRWPLVNAKYRDFPSWHIGNFVDHNDASIVDDTDGDGDDDDLRNPLEITDYNCGDRTYDGHSGIDIGVDPYAWEIKNNGSVHVVAAYAGIIVEKHQGEFDEKCGDLGDDPICHSSPGNRGNYIVMLLDDSSTAIFYMHMKDGSLTTKEVGDYVEKGEYLGTVGSAGCSTGPHLHFEVHLFYNDEDDAGDRIETFLNGSCAWDYSWAAVWENEPPYNDPAVLTLETHSSNPENKYTSSCDKTIDLYYRNAFKTNETVWLRSMFRDWVDGSVVTHEVYDPFGGKSISYIETNPDAERVFVPSDHSFTPAANLVGTWRYTVTFGGKIYDHYFALNCLLTYTLSGAVSKHKGYMCSDHITSTQTISSSSSNYIKYMADGYVTLNPGFQATAGCKFVANTEGCNNSKASFSKASQTEAANVVSKQQVVEANEKTMLKVFPNPSNGAFTLQYNSKEKFTASVIVRNMMGAIVYTIPQKEYYGSLQENINISGKPKGIYMVEIVPGDKKRIATKILIQ